MNLNNIDENLIRALPNKLTLLRIAASPVILVLYPLDFGFINVLCALIFAVAGATDYVDGYIARKYNASSKFGTVLDPVADKVLVASGIIVLAANHAAPIWMLGLLLCRDIVISGVRLLASEHQYVIPVGQMGKAKTLAQMIAIFCLMIDFQLFKLDFHAAGVYFLIVALFFSLYSGYQYIRDFWALYSLPSEKP